MCEGVNGLGIDKRINTMDIWMKELRDDGWIGKRINEWKILLKRDELKSKEMDK
jgi:hypothetical protein